MTTRTVAPFRTARRALSDRASPSTAVSCRDRLAATRRYGHVIGPAPIAPRAALCQPDPRTPYTELAQPMAMDGEPRGGRPPALTSPPAFPSVASAARHATLVIVAAGQRRVTATSASQSQLRTQLGSNGYTARAAAVPAPGSPQQAPSPLAPARGAGESTLREARRGRRRRVRPLRWVREIVGHATPVRTLVGTQATPDAPQDPTVAVAFDGPVKTDGRLADEQSKAACRAMNGRSLPVSGSSLQLARSSRRGRGVASAQGGWDGGWFASLVANVPGAVYRGELSTDWAVQFMSEG